MFPVGNRQDPVSPGPTFVRSTDLTISRSPLAGSFPPPLIAVVPRSAEYPPDPPPPPGGLKEGQLRSWNGRSAYPSTSLGEADTSRISPASIVTDLHDTPELFDSEGYTFVGREGEFSLWYRSDSDKNCYRITATAGAGIVGHFYWDMTDGRIRAVHVHPDFQRKGLATFMHDCAKDMSWTHGFVSPAHSANKTPDGEAWAASQSEPKVATAVMSPAEILSRRLPAEPQLPPGTLVGGMGYGGARPWHVPPPPPIDSSTRPVRRGDRYRGESPVVLFLLGVLCGLILAGIALIVVLG